MHVSIHAFTSPSTEKNIGTIKYCDKVSLDHIKIDVYNIFNLWVVKNKISHAVCNILFIHPEGSNKEWIEWPWGYSAKQNSFYHEIYLCDNKKIIPFEYVK